eukprot:m.13947 g.13947  ORF g.13947 m.13947 type:complete len:173 (-) comp9930_c0_seq1:205-723(-)
MGLTKTFMVASILIVFVAAEDTYNAPQNGRNDPNIPNHEDALVMAERRRQKHRDGGNDRINSNQGGIEQSEECPEGSFHAESSGHADDHCLCKSPTKCRGRKCMRGRAKHETHTDNERVAITGWKLGECANCRCVVKPDPNMEADVGVKEKPYDSQRWEVRNLRDAKPPATD